MRVLFATSLIAALANAGGAPSVKGNSAKRNFGAEAPSRFEQTKELIAPGAKNKNDGDGTLSLQVIIKTDDDNRKQQELHTSLTLEIDGIEPGNEVHMGWAMKITDSKDIKNVEGFLDD